jgi:hypothetical protein
LRMVFAMGMLIGASLGCTFGFVLSGILRSSKLADITDTKVKRSTEQIGLTHPGGGSYSFGRRPARSPSLNTIFGNKHRQGR